MLLDDASLASFYRLVRILFSSWKLVFRTDGVIAARQQSHAIRDVRFLMVTVGFACTLLSGCEAADGADGATRPMMCRLGAAGATAGLAVCLDRAAPGTTVTLAPGRYVLDSPLRITKSVTIRTAGLSDASPRCDITADRRCATLVLAAKAPFANAGQMPVEIRAASVTLSHLRIVGLRGQNKARDRATCQNDRDRPAGGGLRISASDVTLIGSVVRDVTCYTAMEVTPGSDRLIVRNSAIGYNGNHNPGSIWADGLTVHDVKDATIIGNLFTDNTDVQLIFGGCVNCTIRNNVFRHSGSFSGSAFAELMLQSWPTTSGNFTGSVFASNDMDCGAAHRCGFGIMLGSNPWYPGRAFGGMVTDNIVRNAMIGLDVDGLTGVMTVQRNSISGAGGLFPAKCGIRQWPATNVAPLSRRWLRGDQPISSSMATDGCILNEAPTR